MKEVNREQPSNSNPLAGMRKFLPDSHVLNAEQAARRFGYDTDHTSIHIAGAVRPRCEEDVARVVAQAAGSGTGLYPVSTGHNWGYGTALPYRDNCIVVDLSCMNRILDFDKELGVVKVQPGVTTGQMAEYLAQRNLPFLTPVTGAGPSGSLLGNALERGYGITPETDHFQALTSLRAVLADGSLYSSALSHVPGGAGGLHKWGVGPYLDGLFSQSGVGIVTEATFALAPRPQQVMAFLFGVRDPERIDDLVEVVQGIMRDYKGNLGAVNLMNAYRVVSMVHDYPKDYIGAGKALPPELVEALARSNKLMAWTGLGGIYGSARVTRAVHRDIRKRLRPVVDRLVFLTPARVRILELAAAALPKKMGSQLATVAVKLRSTFDILLGKPNDIALQLAYWKSGQRSENGQLDPARDGCGLLWYPPLVPMRPARVREYVAMVTQICTEHGMDPLITLTTLSPRCFDSTVPLLFDPTDNDGVARAHACFQALLQAGTAKGFLVYRAGPHSMAGITAGNADFWSAAERIRQSLDPKGIISPGRYQGHPTDR